jgi:DNA-binding transcriptional ArsR family regulator
VDLDKEDSEKFKKVQNQFKLKNKAEVLRFCVNKVYHGTTLEIDEDLYNEIHKIISSRQIKIRYAITSVDDFIKRSISEFLTILRQEWSLKNWNTRQTLSQDENDTALALLELQMQKIPGVTIEDLGTHLGKDQETISKHLEKFMADALLDFRESHGKIYYYVQ